MRAIGEEARGSNWFSDSLARSLAARAARCVAIALATSFLVSTSQAEGSAPASLYQLKLKLTDQSGEAQPLDIYRGSPVLIAMFYGSCPMACPLLIDTVRATENALTRDERARVRVLLVSVDPERDTPQALAKLAKERRIDLNRWTLARASAGDVRMLAAALNIQYRKLPTGEYNHTSVITLLNSNGEIDRQATTLTRADAEFVAAVRNML